MDDYKISLNGIHMDQAYIKKCNSVYTSTDSPLIPNSIMKEVLNDAWDRCKDGTTVGDVLNESERRRTIFEGGLNMSEFSYTDVWGEKHTLPFGRDAIRKKLAITHDSYRESEEEFRSRAYYIANIFDAVIEFRKDSTGVCEGRLVAYLTFDMDLIRENEEKFDNRVYYATKAFSTYMPHLDRQIPAGRCQKSSGRYPWKSWDLDFDVYHGINHKTGKLQTVVKWNDGETTTVTCNENELPLVYPVAYAYCKRYFGNNSRFKKKVHTRRIGDYIYASLHDNGDHFTASVPARSKKIDIYDEMALVFASSRFGSIMLFEDMCRGNFHRSKEDK